VGTFLEIQNNLLSEFPGMPRPIVKAAISDAYLELYRKWQWSSFERIASVTTVAYIAADVDLGTAATYQTEYVVTPATGEVIDEILEVYSDDQMLSEIPRRELLQLDRDHTSIGIPLYWSKAGKNSTGIKLIEVAPIPDDVYVLDVRCRILPSTTITDALSPMLDSQLVEAFAWLKIAPKAVRILGDKSFVEMMEYKKTYANELYADAMMDDTRASTQYSRIRDVTAGSHLYNSTEYNLDHDLE
jgi:hypothetical protein